MIFNSIKNNKKMEEESSPQYSRSDFVSLEEIANRFSISLDELKKIDSIYPVRVTRYYFNLIEKKGDAIYKQCIPSVEEIDEKLQNVPGVEEDPLHEEPERQLRKNVPKGITHRYPNRVLFLVSNQCATYCRFCTRKRKVGDPKRPLSEKDIERGIEYISQHEEINDVIISGGDPFMLSKSKLESILDRVYSIINKREGIIRIGTRVPVTYPQRINQELINMLKKYKPLYINVHFNHPKEITEESSKACNLLADAGIILGNQTVLLKGVNDDAETLKQLFTKLLYIRVKPYYLYQCDPVKGINHFRTRVEVLEEIYKKLRGWISGLAIPTPVIDSPGGGGKVPCIPKCYEIKENIVELTNYEGKKFFYPQP